MFNVTAKPNTWNALDPAQKAYAAVAIPQWLATTFVGNHAHHVQKKWWNNFSVDTHNRLHAEKPTVSAAAKQFRNIKIVVNIMRMYLATGDSQHQQNVRNTIA